MIEQPDGSFMLDGQTLLLVWFSSMSSRLSLTAKAGKGGLATGCPAKSKTLEGGTRDLRERTRPPWRFRMKGSWPVCLPVPGFFRGPRCIADGVLAPLLGLPGLAAGRPGLTGKDRQAGGQAAWNPQLAITPFDNSYGLLTQRQGDMLCRNWII
jgi:hypothetical protein